MSSDMAAIDRDRLEHYEQRAVPGRPRPRFHEPSTHHAIMSIPKTYRRMSQLDAWRKVAGGTGAECELRASAFRAKALIEANRWARTWGRVWV